MIDSDTTIDLNGHIMMSTLTGDKYLLNARNGATLTLKNGSVLTGSRVGAAVNGGKIQIESGTYNSTGEVAFAAVGHGSKVTMNGGKIIAVEGGIGSFDGAEVEVNAGEISIADNFGLFTNGSSGRGGNRIVLNGGTVTGNITSGGYEACGIYIANNDTFVMNGGDVVANGGVGLLMRAGDVTLNGGSITSVATEAHPAGSSGHVGDSRTNVGMSAVIYQESANYPGKAGMKLTVNDGVFTGIDHSLEVLSNEETPNVHVNGGTFVPAYPET